MKKIILLFILFGFLFTGFSFAKEMDQIKRPKNVRDYFLLLPEKYFSFENLFQGKTREDYLNNNILILDAANGFMRCGLQGTHYIFEMTLFKKLDGKHFIAVTTEGEGEEESSSKCFILDYTNDKWSDISKIIIPEYNPKINRYKLPRYGTTIHVSPKRNNDNKKYYQLIWKQDSFIAEDEKYIFSPQQKSFENYKIDYPKEKNYKDAITATDSSPFLVYWYEILGPQGTRIAIISSVLLDGLWNEPNIFWQEKQWAIDVNNCVFSSDGKYLFVAVNGMYGDSGIYLLDIYNKKSSKIADGDYQTEIIDINFNKSIIEYKKISYSDDHIKEKSKTIKISFQYPKIQ